MLACGTPTVIFAGEDNALTHIFFFLTRPERYERNHSRRSFVTSVTSRNIFSTSGNKLTRCALKRIRTGARLGCCPGPGNTQSLSDTLLFPFAEALKAIILSVVLLSSRLEAWCGKYQIVLSKDPGSGRRTSSGNHFSEQSLIVTMYDLAFSDSRFNFLSIPFRLVHNCSQAIFHGS